jgi:hypothetical protein
MSSEVKLENQGSIASMSLPNGFAKGKEEPDNGYFEFSDGGSAATKFCYWSREFFASPSDVQEIESVLCKAPHKLDQEEIMQMIPCMAPGRWAYNGNFEQVSFQTQDIGGKNVMVAELKFNDQDKRSLVVFANPDANKGTIEIIWFEAPNKAYDTHKNAVAECLQSIKWRGAEKVIR